MSWLNDVTDLVVDTLYNYRPQIEIYSGTALILGSTVYACYKTTKLKEINKKALKRVEDVHKKYEMMEVVDEKQMKKDIAKARLRQIGDLAGNYAAPAIGIATGTALIFDGVHTYDDRLMKSAVAYTNLMTAFNEYRNRTKKEVGEEKEEEIYHNKKRNTEEAMDRDITENPYARLFAETCCDGWDPNPEVSKNTLYMQQASANNIIQSRKRSLGYGWLYLNEVLEMLGYPLTDEGQDVGWFIDDEGNGNPEGIIDFGINRPVNARFLASGSGEVLEQNCWLDFNCCGNIRPLMFRKKHRTSNVYGH